MRAHAVSLALLAGLLLGCEPIPARGWQLARLRVLGARVEADAEPARASLAAGESGRVTWLIAGPEPTPPLEWVSALCVPPPGLYAEPRCAVPFTLDRGSSTDSYPQIRVAAPVDAVGELLLLVAFCASGGAQLNPDRFTGACAEGEPLLASTTIAVGTGNLNPELEADAVRFGNQPWPEPEVCAPALPATLPRASLIDVALRERDREILADGVETLSVSSFVDVGALDRQFAFQDEAPFEQATFTFTPPPLPSAARFVFVLRDGRGGTAFAERRLCLGGSPQQENGSP